MNRDFLGFCGLILALALWCTAALGVVLLALGYEARESQLVKHLLEAVLAPPLAVGSLILLASSPRSSK